jgi:GNAT superfamily N-acetyltransferase
MEIIQANPSHVFALTEIALAAKRHWGYPEAWIESWRPLLTITPEFVDANETWMVLDKEKPIGFYALTRKENKLELIHMWVLPQQMGQGIGRALFSHAVGRARKLNFSTIEIESDPNAEGFYLRMGAQRVGARASKIGQVNRELPILVFRLDLEHRPGLKAAESL